jgi:thiol-disulfide isomerase/thioredoxin
MAFRMLLIVFITFFVLGVTVFKVGPNSAAAIAAKSGLVGTRAPDLSEGKWVNSPPLKLSDLRGKVVLLEFWTFGCYNCRNTIPYLKDWYEKYGREKFEIVGVHSPEFETEKEFSRVAKQTQDLGIRYPVVTDNELKTWRAYDQEYWPVLYLIDKKGVVRYVQVGEGRYQKTESMIRQLLRES